MAETPKLRRRWGRRVLITLGILVVLLVVAGPALVGTILAATLKSMVASQLNADLKMDDVTYRPPYQVTVSGASLIGKDDEGRSAALFEIKSIDLKLAKLPLGKGPLVIKELTIADPTIRIIQTHKGVVGETGLVKDTGPSDPNMKLSEMFELRRVKIDGGRFVYEDRREPNTPAVEWTGMTVDLATQPEDSATYAYDFKATNLPMAEMQAKGRMNIDSLFFDMEKLQIDVTADAKSIPTQLPSKLQELWKQYQVSGKLTVEARAQVPLKELDKIAYEAKVDLKDANAYLVEQKMPLDHVNLRVAVTNAPSALSNQPTTQPALQPMDAPVRMVIDRIHANSGDGEINIRRGNATFSPVENAWKLEDLAGRITFPDKRPPELASLPGPLSDIATRGSVPVLVSGEGKTIPPTPPATQPVTDFSVKMAMNNGSLYFTKHRIPMTKIDADLHMTPAGIKITNFVGSPMRGRLMHARGQLNFDDNVTWALSGQFRDMDLSLLAPALIDGAEDQKRLSGRGTVVGYASGAFGAEDSAGKFKAKGEMSVVNGNLWQIGVLKEVARGVKANRNALTMGEAASTFEIYHRKVFLNEAAISSDLLGIQGSGEIGFDGNLDLTLVAAPLGSDWKKGLEKTHVPIISDVGAAIAGGVQGVTQGVTKMLLYEVRVTGPADEPDVQAIVAPAITGGLVEDMAQNRIEKQRLLEALKKKPPSKNRPTTRPGTFTRVP